MLFCPIYCCNFRPSKPATLDNIVQYIPQRPPFVLVSELLHADAVTTETRFAIPSDHILVENGVLSESGLAENMAQTAAAGTGYLAQQNNTPVPVGFIGAISNLQVQSLPPAGTAILTRVTVKHNILNASVIAAEVFYNEECIASCDMKIFIQ